MQISERFPELASSFGAERKQRETKSGDFQISSNMGCNSVLPDDGQMIAYYKKLCQD